MTEQPAIVVTGVSKVFRKLDQRPTSLKERVTSMRRIRYEEHWAVRDVTLEIPRGAFYGLVGHNGSGKSSLLRLIAGIHRPTSGSVAVHGRVSALLELGAGFHPDLTGRENVYLNASILGMRRTEVDRIFDDIVDFSQLESISPGAIDTPVKHYSSGMFVRLGFAVAVHVNPEILLIDEVIAVGDEEFQRRCFEHLYHLRAQGVTIVIVSHAVAVVQNVCSGAAWLDHGELQLEGAAPDVVTAYLERVNEAEEARLEAEAREHAPEGEQVDRAAVHAIQVEGVEVLDAQGRSVRTAHTGDPLTVRVHWSAAEPVHGATFTLGINSDSGQHVGVAPMRPGEHHHEYVGDGFIDYHMPRLVLAPGDFHLGVDIHDANGMIRFDHREKAAALKVQPGRDFVLGLADLQGRWTAPATDGAAQDPASP